jgi:GNAT superfamily N-acetyltransferase
VTNTGPIEYREATQADRDALMQMRMAFLEEYSGGLTPEQSKAIHTQYRDYLKRRLGIDFFAWLACTGKDAGGEPFLSAGDAAGSEPFASVCLELMEKPANLRSLNGRFATVFSDLALNNVNKKQVVWASSWVVGEAHVSVYTKPDYRHQGHASKLCELAIERAREHAVTCIDLVATPAGHPLYEKLGFVDHITSCTNMMMQMDADG